MPIDGSEWTDSNNLGTSRYDPKNGQIIGMISYFGSILELVLIVVALLSGALSIVRDLQKMYSPARTDDKRLFWGWVRIAFVISAVLVWWNAFSSMKGREQDLHEKELATLAAQHLNGDLQTENRILKERAPTSYSAYPRTEIRRRLVKLIDEIRAFDVRRNSSRPPGLDPLTITYIDRSKEKEKWEEEYRKLQVPYEARMKAHDAETQRIYESTIEPRLVKLLTEIENSAGIDVAGAMRAVKEPYAQSSTPALESINSFQTRIVYELKSVLDKI